MNLYFQRHDACIAGGPFYRNAARNLDLKGQAIKSTLLSRGFSLGVDPRTHLFFFNP